MAQKIITICDAHLMRGEEQDVLATTYTVAGYEVDLCEQDSQMSFADAVTFAQQFGRKAESNGAKPKKAKAPKVKEAAVPEKPGCPYCPSEFASVRGVNAHIGQKHKGKDLIS